MKSLRLRFSIIPPAIGLTLIAIPTIVGEEVRGFRIFTGSRWIIRDLHFDFRAER
jgi:hypothetical protein